MDFQSYAKIPESSKKWKLTSEQYKQINTCTWVATEKVHGAHFVFLTNGRHVQCAKRKSLLSEKDTFFGYKTLYEELSSKVLRLFECIHGLKGTPLKQIAVHGELFGGCYPHPDVPQNPNVEAIQTGVYYSPNIEFCAFDICLYFTSSHTQFLSYPIAIELFQEVDMLYAEPLCIGSFQELIQWPLPFETTWPCKWGLPSIAENVAEGIVIKPFEEIIWEGVTNATFRPVIKRKIEHFSEKKKFHGAQKWKEVTTSETFERLKWECIARVTHNRLQTTNSKVGSWYDGDQIRARSIYRAFIHDIWEELEEECSSMLNTLTHTEHQQLQSILHQESRVLFQRHAPQRTIPKKLQKYSSCSRISQATLRSFSKHELKLKNKENQNV